MKRQQVCSNLSLVSFGTWLMYHYSLLLSCSWFTNINKGSSWHPLVHTGLHGSIYAIIWQVWFGQTSLTKQKMGSREVWIRTCDFWFLESTWTPYMIPCFSASWCGSVDKIFIYYWLPRPYFISLAWIELYWAYLMDLGGSCDHH